MPTVPTREDMAAEAADARRRCAEAADAVARLSWLRRAMALEWHLRAKP